MGGGSYLVLVKSDATWLFPGPWPKKLQSASKNLVFIRSRVQVLHMFFHDRSGDFQRFWWRTSRQDWSLGTQ